MAKESVQLQSTMLRSADYDDESEQMNLHFANGRTYTCERVPRTVFDGLCNASSPGTFFNENIKGVY